MLPHGAGVHLDGLKFELLPRKMRSPRISCRYAAADGLCPDEHDAEPLLGCVGAVHDTRTLPVSEGMPLAPVALTVSGGLGCVAFAADADIWVVEGQSRPVRS